MDALEQKTNEVMEAYLDMQLICMMLHYAAERETRQGDKERGLLMLEAVEEMRDILQQREEKMRNVFDEEEIGRACDAIGFARSLYNGLNDAMLESNQEFFPLPPRPPMEEFACDEAKCEKRLDELMSEYFPVAA